MPVTNTAVRFPYSGNGVTTSFPFTCKIFNANELQVYLNGILQATGYTVTILAGGGGNVVFTTAPAAAVPILILRHTPRTQATDWVENDPDPASAKENAFDKQMNIVQEMDDTFFHTLRAPLIDDVIVELPAKASRANGYLAFDSNGNPIIAASPSISGTTVVATGSSVARTLAERFATDKNVLDYGADSTGVADSTAAINNAVAAAQATGGNVVFPPGIYRVTSTIVITIAVHFIGLGSGPGGNTAIGNNNNKAAVLEHDFNGTMFQVIGVNGDVIAGVGTSFENILFRQKDGAGAGASGTCIQVLKQSDTFAPSWFRIHDCTFEVGAGKNDWTWALDLDGSAAATGPAAGGGLRDTYLSNLRITSGANATGSIRITACGNLWARDITCNLTKAIVLVTGPSAPKASGGMNFSNVTADTISLDQVISLGWYGGQVATYVDTANTQAAVLNLAQLTNNPAAYLAINSHLYVGKFGPTGGPALFATQGIELHTNVLTFKAGVQGNFGTVDAFPLSIVAGNVPALRLESADQNVKPQAGFVPKLVRPAYGANVTLNILTATDFWIAVTNGVAFNILSNGAPYDGQQITVWVSNQSGGAMGAITWPAAYKMSAWVNPANAQNRSITLVFDTTTGNWHEISRTPADVPN